MAEGSDTKLRIIRRLNVLVNQSFLYIYVCKTIYNRNGGGYNIEYAYNIFYIGAFYNIHIYHLKTIQ